MKWLAAQAANAAEGGALDLNTLSYTRVREKT
jgi:hypothetical protein